MKSFSHEKSKFAAPSHACIGEFILNFFYIAFNNVSASGKNLWYVIAVSLSIVNIYIQLVKSPTTAVVGKRNVIYLGNLKLY